MAKGAIGGLWSVPGIVWLAYNILQNVVVKWGRARNWAAGRGVLPTQGTRATGETPVAPVGGRNATGETPVAPEEGRRVL